MPVSFKELKGSILRGRMIIEVPEQTKDAPKRGIDYANQQRIKIWDINGKTTIRYEDNIQ